MRLVLLVALVATACHSPSAVKCDSSDSAPTDTGSACDPAVGSLEAPDFHAELDLLTVAVSPAALDPATDLQPEDDHQVYVLAAGATPAPLFLMLPGTDGRPENNQQILTTAAESGYRAIGLAYPTETNQNDLCGEDLVCAEAFTLEKVYGTDETDVIDIDEADAIVGRLTRLLTALAQRYPGAGWEAYLDTGAPAWGNIAVAGFSQGSGMASWLARDHAMARFTTFSGGCDSVGSSPEDAHPADWCYEPRATPAERTFGILHTEHYFDIKRQIYEDALDLDRFGPFADADDESPAYCTGTHILTTSLVPADAAAPDAYHKSLTVDDVMPLDAEGVPLLAEDQWYLMAGGS